MLKKISILVAASTIVTGTVWAQTRPTPKPSQPVPERVEQQPQEQPAPREQPRPELQGRPLNVKLELTISDQTGPGEPSKKVVTMIVADRERGSIRSLATMRVVSNPGVSVVTERMVTINVDARPVILRDVLVRVDLGLEYQPSVPSDRSAATASAAPAVSPDPLGANLTERIVVFVESGKPFVLSQAADPSSERRISVELKATILK